MSARTQAYFWLLLATAIWGVAGPVIKFTLNTGIDPSLFLIYRFGLSSVIGVVALAMSPTLVWPKTSIQWFHLLFFSFLTSTVSLGLLFFGYEHTSSAAAAILSTVFPILVAIAGSWYLHEQVTRREKIGLVIGLIGTLIVTVDTSPSDPSSVWGNLLVIASLLVGVGLSIYGKKLLTFKSLSPTTLTHTSFIVGFVTMFPVALLFGTPITFEFPLTTHLGVWYMALLSGTLAYLVWYKGQKVIEASEAAVFSYLYPIITLPLSIWWLHERITPAFIFGCLIILVGVVLAQLRPAKRRPNRHR